jgi:hypothetical protein
MPVYEAQLIPSGAAIHERQGQYQSPIVAMRPEDRWMPIQSRLQPSRWAHMSVNAFHAYR